MSTPAATSPLNVAQTLNRACYCRTLNPERLRQQLETDPHLAGMAQDLARTHPHLFASTVVFLSQDTANQIRAAVSALEGVIALPAYQHQALERAPAKAPDVQTPDLPAARLDELVNELAATGKGLIMVMGKGGVGKTSIAAALALGLVQRGHAVHLSTTDPAAHLAVTLQEEVSGLKVYRIDPKAETQRYIDKIMATKGKGMDEQERALMLEDLQSPCTEEVAVFHAFSRTVGEARSAFVVLDTAPTGHSLLLMDATGAYHRQMTREFDGKTSVHMVTPLMRLHDPHYTRIILVTLPEVTSVSQAAALQDDLRRAKIEPYAWVINKSILAAGTRDPLLRARLHGEYQQMARITNGLAQRTHLVPWLEEAPVGPAGLKRLLSQD